MGRIVIVAYRPLPGKDAELQVLVRTHTEVLSKEDLITTRKPIVMRAEDGCILEIFEWQSQDAINNAHKNPRVLKLWEEFAAVCTFEPPGVIKEFQNLFSEFESVN